MRSGAKELAEQAEYLQHCATEERLHVVVVLTPDKHCEPPHLQVLFILLHRLHPHPRTSPMEPSLNIMRAPQVIDEDTLRNRRSESMSVSVHGVQALFVKPAQSLSPILGMAVLPQGALKDKLADMTPEQVRVCVCLHPLLCHPSACCFVPGRRRALPCTAISLSFSLSLSVEYKLIFTHGAEITRYVRINWRDGDLSKRWKFNRAEEV